ncbi:hypothetical protein SAMN04487968_10763 [Nocardioides terrae]|uniref:Uncharacterized protein n=1 Tax=Nocardioides terrae TaxID=574651 RepID=A0A1I1JM35_9ACTN|nr:hypothetical protein [Nocardioides terrae]SFC49435.1 hypothetical protein SAMN04487968_10763 [Nocardioides terrae]
MLDDPADPPIDRASAPPVVSATPGPGSERIPDVRRAHDPTVRDFARRVEERAGLAAYRHGTRRVVHTLGELAEVRDVRRHANVWVPLATFAVTAVCAVLVALLTTTLAEPGHGWATELAAGIVTIAVVVGGFAVLTRAQDHFEERGPRGRLVRADLADAYETIRDGTAVLVRLGVPPSALAMVADLLPRADRMLGLLVEHEARGGDVRRHAAYGALIRMGAQVTVLTDMAEERMGQRSGMRRDRPLPAPPRVEPTPAERALSTLEVIADLIEMLGPDVPRHRGRNGVS